MNTQTNNIALTTSKVSRIVSMVCAAAALLLTLTWFMPVVEIFEESFSMLETLDYLSGEDAETAAAGFWIIVVIYGISVIWAVIRKKWAAIVGMIYALVPMMISIAQVNDWKANLDLAVGANLMIPLSLLVFALSVAKLVLIIKEKKQNQVNPADAAEQPAAPVM